ncbi:BlaI/MecI/CopY family transcriptional regulator [Mucilaginibacter lappiensis]|jgi:predicted transcriptional regulator|uniref:BlaI/MecI/CopY family transcriptional regulator n=1 Tax=Mucilaginibacter lappiensis TaxID=354630 RepID=UPI003D1E1F67
MEIIKLTRLEEEVMQIIWELESGNVNEIIKNWKKKPLPAYNTISTIVRILVKKGFLTTNTTAKAHIYIPQISKEGYLEKLVDDLVDNFQFSIANLILKNFQIGKCSLTDLHQMETILK